MGSLTKKDHYTPSYHAISYNNNIMDYNSVLFCTMFSFIGPYKTEIYLKPVGTCEKPDYRYQTGFKKVLFKCV